MTGHLLFVILLYSFCEVKALPEPKLTLSRSEITEKDSVTLKCEAPSSVPMSQCSFYSPTGATVKELPCLTTLTATELLKMSNLKSPATVKLNCFYTTNPGAPNSPYSDFSSIIIQTLPPKLIINPPVITETDSVTLNCETPPSVSVPECYFYTLSGAAVKELPCLTTLTATKLLKMANLKSPANIKLNCFYTTQPGAPNSPYSDFSSIIIQTPPPKLIIDPPVITETDSVTLNCETPPSVSVPECYFYTLSGRTVNKFSCLTTLTATKLLEMANLRTPAEIEASCSYPAHSGELTSPYSNMSTIKVQRTTSKDGRTTDLITVIPGKTSSGDKVHTGANLEDKRTTDLTTFSPGTVSHGKRDHTGTTSKDGRTTDLTTVIPGKTSSGDKGHTDQLTRNLLMVSTGCGFAVGVVLLGCVLVRNLQRTVPVNSVTSRSQVHCTDGLMNTTHLGEGPPPGNQEAYSVITSVPAADPDSTQEDGQQLQKNESDIYDLYSSIPEEPATSAMKSMVYSTVNPLYTSVNSV